MSLGLVLNLIHKNNVTKNAPDTFTAKNKSWLTQVCKKGFNSKARPFVTRNWVIKPSATIRQNRV